MGTAINGYWQTINVYGARQFTDIYVNGSHAMLCKGQGIAFYNITSQNQIIFTIIKSKGCSSNEMSVLNALDTAVYYRIRDKLLLYLYDYRLSTVISANMLDNIRADQMITFAPVKDQKNESQSSSKATASKNDSSLNNTAISATNQSQVTKPSTDAPILKPNSQSK